MNTFERYAPFVQDFIYANGWERLRPIQIEAARVIFDTNDNLILSSEKLFLADNTKSYSSLDVWGARLSFTTENARECVEIIRRYMGEGEYKPSNTTRGLYFGRAPGV